MSTEISFADLGMKTQSQEFYTALNDEYLEKLDDLDKARMAFYLSTQIVKGESKMHPVAIMALMELCQKCEVQCASIKKMLGDTIIESVECKKCNKRLPRMTILQHLNGVNAKCPHDDCEVEIEDKSERTA
jgi:hypothetical protein